MTEEEFKAREIELMDIAAKAEADKQAAVSELIEKRESERLAKEELAREKDKQTNPNLDNTDPTRIVEQVLEKRKQEDSKKAFEDALQEMKKTYNEFAPETDAAGLVFKKFETEMSKFNFSGLTTKDEYKTRLKEVYEHMNRATRNQESNSFHSGTPQFGSEHRTMDSAGLSEKEQRLMRDMGWDKDRFLKAKAKRPAYVASLLNLRG